MNIFLDAAKGRKDDQGFYKPLGEEHKKRHE
ncbi:MAG: hypothetical protein ACI93R_003147 [Flavobacteriales bacterium]|jgi:hypothetical protein